VSEFSDESASRVGNFVPLTAVSISARKQWREFFPIHHPAPQLHQQSAWITTRVVPDGQNFQWSKL
jgi:hypothetical protein